MPKIDKNEYAAAETVGGEFKRMPAGGYVCAIQAVRTDGKDGYGRAIDYVQEKMYVKLIFDVIEGEYAGYYSDDYWATPERDYGHQFFLSWKNLGALKNAITCLDESNPGFDAMAAFEADQWELFIGKKMGLVIGEEEYTANDGSIKTRHTLPRIKSVADIEAGKFRVPALKTLNGGTQTLNGVSFPAAAAPAADNYDDVPFM